MVGLPSTLWRQSHADSSGGLIKESAWREFQGGTDKGWTEQNGEMTEEWRTSRVKEELVKTGRQGKSS